MEKLKIEYLPIDEIKPYEKNAKKHPPEQIEYIANSIEKFGFKQPILVDKDNVVISGHGRLLAARLVGLDKVPVVCATDLTDNQVKALRIADNKIGERGSWDDLVLGEELKLILDDIDMTELGFGDFEITILTEDLTPVPFDDSELEQYTQNEENYLARRRVIITFPPDKEQDIINLLGVEGKLKVVYEIEELSDKI